MSKLFQGQFFSGNNQRIYLLGNPIIWWGNIAFLIIFTLVYINAAVREQRGCDEDQAAVQQRKTVMNAGCWLFVGWLLHYAPFWAMTRVLYFHHYFPALLYSSMLTGITLDYILESLVVILPERIGKTIYHVLIGTVISAVVYRYFKSLNLNSVIQKIQNNKKLISFTVFIFFHPWCMEWMDHLLMILIVQCIHFGGWTHGNFKGQHLTRVTF